MPNDNAKFLRLVEKFLEPLKNQVYYNSLRDGFLDLSRFIVYARMFAHFSNLNNAKILDVGCGSGGMSGTLRLFDAIPIGIDTDLTSIQISKVRFPNLDFLVTGGAILPFSNNVFDGVILLHVIEHVQEPQAVINEVNRVLKIGSLLLMECPNRFYPLEPHQKIPLITLFPKSLANLILKFIAKMPVSNNFKSRCLAVVNTLPNFVSYFTLRRLAHNGGFKILGSNELYKMALQPPGDKKIHFGFDDKNLIPVAGNWNGDGKDTIGLYQPSTGTFFLKNTNEPGSADLTFRFGPIGGVIPLTGDWNGDGIDTIGVYQKASGTFFLKNTNEPGSDDLTFTYGSIGNVIPISGDWYGRGYDTIGIYEKKTGSFFLNQFNSSNNTGSIFTKILKSQKSFVLTGDWDGDGKDTVGFYDIESGHTYLFGQNSDNVSIKITKKMILGSNFLSPNTLVICKKVSNL